MSERIKSPQLYRLSYQPFGSRSDRERSLYHWCTRSLPFVGATDSTGEVSS